MDSTVTNILLAILLRFEIMYVDVKLRKFFGQNSNLFKVNVHGTENRILDLLLYVCWEKFEEFPTIIKLVILCS